MVQQRLQQFLASAGLDSRRKCEELILKGRISVNGKPVDSLGIKVDTDLDEIRCDGDIIRPQPKAYYIMNKPQSTLCTNDPKCTGSRVIDIIPNSKQLRLFTVGRLDFETEGLILITNDGELAQKVAHPRNEMSKTYLVHLRGQIEGESIERLQKGIFLSEGKTSPAKVRIIKRSRQTSIVEITIHEGFNRQVRRMFSRVGHTVTYLERISIGPLKLGKLRQGEFRALTKEEISKLLNYQPAAGHKKKPFRNRANKMSYNKEKYLEASKNNGQGSSQGSSKGSSKSSSKGKGFGKSKGKSKGIGKSKSKGFGKSRGKK